MIKPHQHSKGKKEQVVAMFDSIAGKYDFLNHLLSLGIDKYWRKRAVASLKQVRPTTILDIASGTGDLAITAMELQPKKVVGIDISNEMLSLGRKKVWKRKLQGKIHMINGDSENLPFDEGSFDAVMVAFGVRNYENLQKGLEEAFRVLKKNGKMVILEFSYPVIFPVKQLYHFYFSIILPVIGRIFSKHQSAYAYLPESVRDFPQGQRFLENMKLSGFEDVELKRLTFGICSLYTGMKRCYNDTY